MDHPPRDHDSPAEALDTDAHNVSPPNESSNDIGLSPLVSSLSVKYRPGYQRIASVSDDQYASTTFAKTNPDYSSTSPRLQNEIGEGLGLQNVTTQRPHSISRKPVNNHHPRSPSSDTTTPTLNDVLLSPPSRLPSSTLPELREHKIDDDSYDEDGLSPDPHLKRGHTESTVSLGKHAGSISGWSPSVSGLDPDFRCPAREVHHGRGNWLSVTILILSVYSTVFSGIWLVLSIAKPRYGHRISASSKLPPASASILFAALAKSIELSFVTVFVALLGQVLSRRAFRMRSKGITIAEMSMRSWVMQPGTMITHWETIRYAGLTVLGIIALLAALMAMIYTTASDALVAPKLRYSRAEPRTLYGKVATQFANNAYIQGKCHTPILTRDDPEYAGSTCISIEHSGQAFHHYMQWLTAWTTSRDQGNGTSDPLLRPAPVGIYLDNTTLTGSWLDAGSNTDLSAKYGRIVHNVTGAMPHTGLFSAVRDPRNNILQPKDLNGLGEYEVEASIPSPSVNVLCAEMSEKELAPLVYTEWPGWKKYNQKNVTNFPVNTYTPTTPDWLNRTVVDDLFGFGEKYNRRPPVFPKYPIPYNTIVNDTTISADSLYILVTSPASSYMLCSLRVSQTVNCSTTYKASTAGGNLGAHCNHNGNPLAYSQRYGNATNGILNTDWSVGIAPVWARALSLNAGVTDGAASNARLLSQLIPTEPAFNPSLPSISEALAVLAGCTLVLSTIDAPFIHFWNYSTTVPTLAEPQYQSFPGTLKVLSYASGGASAWQGVFYIVLVSVFLTNCFCLVYFLIRGGLVTDFMEPQNLFALAVNSPPSRKLSGSCGSGPNAQQIQGNWYIKMDGERDHFYIQSGDKEIRLRKNTRGRGRRQTFEMLGSPIAQTYSKLSNTRASLL